MSNRGDKSSGRSMGCQGGCAGCGCVLTVGLVFALVGGALGVSISARIPATHSNVTVAGSIGKKELVEAVLPPYARATFAHNHNFINGSSTLTVGPAQGLQEFVVGKQPRAPVAKIDVEWKRK